MISNQRPCSNEVISKSEVNIIKRKAPQSESLLTTPPNKLPRTDSKSPILEEKLESSCPEEFNSYQYWKDPLPDITNELLKLPSCMQCD